MQFVEPLRTQCVRLGLTVGLGGLLVACGGPSAPPSSGPGDPPPSAPTAAVVVPTPTAIPTAVPAPPAAESQGPALPEDYDRRLNLFLDFMRSEQLAVNASGGDNSGRAAIEAGMGFVQSAFPDAPVKLDQAARVDEWDNVKPGHIIHFQYVDATSTTEYYMLVIGAGKAQGNPFFELIGFRNGSAVRTVFYPNQSPDQFGALKMEVLGDNGMRLPGHGIPYSDIITVYDPMLSPQAAADIGSSAQPAQPDTPPQSPTSAAAPPSDCESDLAARLLTVYQSNPDTDTSTLILAAIQNNVNEGARADINAMRLGLDPQQALEQLTERVGGGDMPFDQLRPGNLLQYRVINEGIARQQWAAVLDARDVPGRGKFVVVVTQDQTTGKLGIREVPYEQIASIGAQVYSMNAGVQDDCVPATAEERAKLSEVIGAFLDRIIQEVDSAGAFVVDQVENPDSWLRSGIKKLFDLFTAPTLPTSTPGR